MFASLRIETVFKCAAKGPKPPRAHSGEGAASVIPELKADRDARLAEPADTWSVLPPLDDGDTKGSGQPSPEWTNRV